MAQAKHLGSCVWSRSVNAASCEETGSWDKNLPLVSPPRQGALKPPCLSSLSSGTGLHVLCATKDQREQAATSTNGSSQLSEFPVLEEGVQLSPSAGISSPTSRSEGAVWMDEQLPSFTQATDWASIQETAGTEAPQHIFNPQSQDTSLPVPLTLPPVLAQTSCRVARGGCSTLAFCSLLCLEAFLLCYPAKGRESPW